MAIQNLKEKIKDYGKDIRLNLSSVISEEGAPGLTSNQIFGVALASAYQTKNVDVIDALEAEAKEHISAEEIEAAKAAATIMAMNNVYYRYAHLSGDREFSNMPAKLRMSIIGKPGIDKTDFELYSLAVSALNACSGCVRAHEKVVKEAGITNEGIQSSIRIASVVNAAAQALSIN